MQETRSPSILVWDAPVRVFHWLLVFCFFGAFVSAESERWRLLHITLGYTAGALVALRLLWGVIGTRHARFAAFVRGPREVLGYLASLRRGAPAHYVGHNPAGALAIVGLLGLTLVVSLSGWAVEANVGPHALEALHKAAGNLMLGVVGLHVAGVLISSWLHRENLIAAMLTGRKPGPPQQGIERRWRSVAALLLAGVLGFWWLQWNDRPVGGALTAQAASARQPDTRSDDD